MRREQRIAINALTRDILKILDVKVPVDVNVVVEKLSGYILENNNIKNGSIKKNGDSFEIYVNPSQSDERKRFTIAHELGHLFLDMGYLMDLECWEKQDSQEYFREGKTENEFMANEFAASLLMPREEYLDCINTYEENGLVDINRISEYFNVSYEAALNRGKFLGILKW